MIDGDTLVVLDAAKTQQKIRLQGIDAPERGQAFGTKSKEHLSDLVAGQVVVVEYHDLDRYQRILGKVLLDGEDINLEQVSSGMAWHYKKYQREQTPQIGFGIQMQSVRQGGRNWGCGMIRTRSRPGITGRRSGISGRAWSRLWANRRYGDREWNPWCAGF